MRDPARIEKTLGLIRSIWYRYPDLRFFQMVEYVKSIVEKNGADAFYVEDDLLPDILAKLDG